TSRTRLRASDRRQAIPAAAAVTEPIRSANRTHEAVARTRGDHATNGTRGKAGTSTQRGHDRASISIMPKHTAAPRRCAGMAGKGGGESTIKDLGPANRSRRLLA